MSLAGLLLILLVKRCHCQCRHWLTPEFHFASNRILHGHVFQTKTISSAVICGRDCSMDPQCASFNYDAGSHLCELNNQTRLQSPYAFVEKQESFYFDSNYETSFFSAPDAEKYTSCQMLRNAGYDSAIYTIYPYGIAEGLQVYCDMETDGGGWIVFQRRQDGSVNFTRNWTDYQSGFGNLSGEFWLGNEALRLLTETGQWQLRVDLEDWKGNTAWAEYGEFGVSGDKYTLRVGSFNPTSTAGDALAHHNARHFSTWDQDNDSVGSSNCANKYGGGWWFRKCFVYGCHLNGIYMHCQTPCSQSANGLQWFPWKLNYSLKQSKIKLRETTITA
ncbi:microfibril-associated glycoprotein 4-like [Patiria miniata]|uniref:Fibrinogen C-terminal domain-containing protein n=1 Tax=Patiria miniata TaxID=46514 RepID=A0A914AFT4_PATMI|nr:microfibril-associated glycoprotein 4-like [Patiria miniata]